jgi:hypothetical protein
MAFCTNCGAQFEGNFCGACGSAASQPAQASAGPGSQYGSFSPAVQQQTLKESTAVTALSAIGLVFGFLGLIGAFIPCFGTVAFLIALPGILAAVLALALAFAQNASRTFPFISLAVSLLGVVLSGLHQYGMMSMVERMQRLPYGR